MSKRQAWDISFTDSIQAPCSTRPDEAINGTIARYMSQFHLSKMCFFRNHGWKFLFGRIATADFELINNPKPIL